MSKSQRLANIFSNDWVVTLSATLIGVFLALYLNEWMAQKKQDAYMATAIENIELEIKSNSTSLSNVIEQHETFKDVLGFLDAYINDENEFVAHTDSITKFKNKYPDLLILTDSIDLGSGIYQYNGELNYFFNLPQHNLSTIAVKAMKDSGINTNLEYNCLLYLEQIQNWTNEVMERNDELFDQFFEVNDDNSFSDKFKVSLNFLIQFEKGLLEQYRPYKETLEKCK